MPWPLLLQSLYVRHSLQSQPATLTSVCNFHLAQGAQMPRYSKQRNIYPIFTSGICTVHPEQDKLHNLQGENAICAEEGSTHFLYEGHLSGGFWRRPSARGRSGSFRIARRCQGAERRPMDLPRTNRSLRSLLLRQQPRCIPKSFYRNWGGLCPTNLNTCLEGKYQIAPQERILAACAAWQC